MAERRWRVRLGAAAELDFANIVKWTTENFGARHAAGPPAASTRSVLGLLKGYWRGFQERRQRHWLRVSLHDLSDRELMDIGVTRAEIECIAAHRAIDRLRDGTTQLWMSRGVM
jgi:uncharacterized protein YjiS (DUF1127 family)